MVHGHYRYQTRTFFSFELAKVYHSFQGLGKQILTKPKDFSSLQPVIPKNYSKDTEGPAHPKFCHCWVVFHTILHLSAEKRTYEEQIINFTI